MSNNNINYGEIICTAVDEIITSKLQGLSYDITKQCTIVNDSLRKQGKYTVTDGSIRFDACSEDTTLSKGNNVLVMIPNGDYNMQKIIMGRVSVDSTTPFNYKSPLNNMAKFTSNIMDQPGITYPKENTGLQANGKTAIIGPIYSISDADNFAGFTRLGVSAEFQSWLGEYNIVTGTYGIKLLIYADGSTMPGVSKELVYELTFNSEDMIGNPYQFDTYFIQEKVFDITKLNNIKKIDVYFYQDGQFYDGNGNYIQYNTLLNNDEDIGLDNSFIEFNNLFVNNVAVYLGYESSAFEEETLMLYSADSLTYHYLAYPPFTESGASKQLSLRWVHKIDDANFEILSGTNLDSKYEVHWFRYKPGAKNINQFAGPDWEELPWPQDLESVLATIDKESMSEEEYANEIKRLTDIHIEQYEGDKFTYSFMPDSTNQQEQIKVVGYIKQGYGENAVIEDSNLLSNVIAFTSNILTFRNEEQVPDNLTYIVSTQLTIAYEDNSDGNYFLYNQNGKIINEGAGQGYRRRVQARFKGAPIDSSLGTIDYIKWYFPYESQQGNTYTMLINTEEKYEIEDYKGHDYMVITRFPDQYTADIDNYQSYYIKNTWYQANSNNTIRCVVSINGVLYEAIEEMKFGKAGSQGTNITLVLDFMYGKNALEYNPDNKASYILIPSLTEEEFKLDNYYIYSEISANNFDYILATQYSEKDTYYYKSIPEQDIYVQAIMYDMSGKRIYDKYGTWKWSWYNGDNDIITINDKTFGIDENGNTIEEPINSNIIRLTSQLESIPANNYSILQVAFEQLGSTTLYAYLPIPIKQTTYSHIEGAREIIYNHQGVPSYYTDAYVLYKLDNETDKYVEVSCDWNLSYEDNFEVDGTISNMSASYLPTLQTLIKEGTVYKALCASPFYASGFNNRICVNSYDPKTNTIIWSQPILLLQSKYDFAMLNEWDGKLKTDESKGTILSTMLGAGRKNKNNTFSGVLIGDVQDATDFVEGGSYLKIGKINKEEFKIGQYYTYRNYAYYPAFIYDKETEYYILQNLTGVYGLHEGQISFSLKENGIATFGKAGKGQIIINGNESTIKSSSFDTIGSGLKLDLDDGLLHVKDLNKNKVIIQPNDPYLQVFGESSEVPIINVGDSEYFLQSDKYAIGGLGSKLDLVKGTFNIKGSGGSVVLSGDRDESFFKVQNNSLITLINMDNNEYYLQSASYGGTVQLNIEDESGQKYLIYSNDNHELIALDAIDRETLYKVKDISFEEFKKEWKDNSIENFKGFTNANLKDNFNFIKLKDAVANLLHLEKVDLNLLGSDEDILAFLTEARNKELLDSIAIENLYNYNSRSLRELKYEFVVNIISSYLQYPNMLTISTGNGLTYDDITSISINDRKENELLILCGDILKDNKRYEMYQFKNKKWIVYTDVSYTQMQLRSFFELAHLRFLMTYIDYSSKVNIDFSLGDTNRWEFKFLFTLISNFKTPANDEGVNKLNTILNTFIKLNYFNFIKEDTKLSLTKVTDILKTKYEEILNGITLIKEEYVDYTATTEVTYDKENLNIIGSFYTYNEDDDTYINVSNKLYDSNLTYFKQETKEKEVSTELSNSVYTSQSLKGNYILIVDPALIGESSKINVYGLKCDVYKLKDTYSTLYAKDTAIKPSEFVGIYDILTGRYDEKGNPITESVEADEETGKSIYISKLKPIMIASQPNGIKIDLDSGHIDGYNLHLQGIGEKGTFILSSQDPEIPFKIGENLSISWEGKMFCQDVKYIGNVASNGNYVINIGNGLKVNASGGGSFAGYCSSAGYADSAGTANHASTSNYAYSAKIADTVKEVPQHSHTVISAWGTATVSGEVIIQIPEGVVGPIRVRAPATLSGYVSTSNGTLSLNSVNLI